MLIPTIDKQEDVNDVLELVDTIRAAGVRHIVLLSLFGTHYESFELARIYNRIESYVEKCGMKWTTLRHTILMENLFGAGEAILDNGVFVSGIGDGKVAPVCVDDVGRSMAAVLSGVDEHFEKVYDITGPQAIGGVHCATLISETFNCQVEYRPQSTEQLQINLHPLGYGEWKIDALSEMFQLMSDNHMSMTSKDTRLLSGIHTTFKEWLLDSAALFGEQIDPSDKPYIVVVGAHTSIGFSAAKALCKYNSNGKYSLRALVQTEEQADRIREYLEPKGVEIIWNEDYLKPTSLYVAFDNAKKIFLPPLLESTHGLGNVVDMKAVIDTATAAGVRHTVLISYYGAQYESFHFGTQMRDIEQHLESSGMRWTVLRSTILFEQMVGGFACVRNQDCFYGAFGDGLFSSMSSDGMYLFMYPCVSIPFFVSRFLCVFCVSFFYGVLFQLGCCSLMVFFL